MSQADRDSGPLHHAAVHVVAICLLGWLTLFSSHRGQSDANADGETGGVVGGQAGPLLKIRLNDAGASELELLPSIGPNMAARVLRYRQKNGDFESWSDLQQVVGMGPSTIHAIRPYCDLSRAAENSEPAEMKRPAAVSRVPARGSQQDLRYRASPKLATSSAVSGTAPVLWDD